MLRGALVFLNCSLALVAAKKPVTLEAVTPGGRFAPGGGPAAVQWAPDGNSFLWQQGARVMVYDIPARSEKGLFTTDEMEKAAKSYPESSVFEWENRR